LSRGRKLLLFSIRPLESSLYRLEKVAFLFGQESEIYFILPLVNLIHPLIEFIKIAFWAGQEAENAFAVPCNHYKITFLLHQVGFCAGPEAGNKLKMPCEPLTNCFLDLSQFAFRMFKRPKMSSK